MYIDISTSSLEKASTIPNSRTILRRTILNSRTRIVHKNIGTCGECVGIASPVFVGTAVGAGLPPVRVRLHGQQRSWNGHRQEALDSSPPALRWHQGKFVQSSLLVLCANSGPKTSKNDFLVVIRKV